jgi:putative MATE family efflux protein
MLIKVTVIAGILISVLGIIFTKEIAILLGATGELLEPCITYGRVLLISLTAFMLQNVFQSFMVTAEKPTLGLIVTVAAGMTNIIVDFLLVGVWHGGVVGAAVATGISQFVGGIVPMIYFSVENSSELRVVPAKVQYKILGQICFNGSSELMTNVSFSLVNMLYNLQLLKYAGENGVAAYGVIMYVNFIFISVFIGYAIGTAPIVGYHYGANNRSELHNVYKKSILFNIVSGIVMCVAAILLSGPLSAIFVSYDPELYAMTKNGFVLYSLSFVVIGINIYASSFFTALGNGLISAILSFLRTLLFQVVAVMLLPLIWDLNGIWFSITAAELMALVVTFVMLGVNKKKYGY